jgi:hypothetical protein
MAFDTYVAEYKAYRDEWLEIGKQREHLLLLSLIITGTLFSFYFTATQASDPQSEYRARALYLVVPLCLLTGARWIEQGWRQRQIDAYIAEVLALRVNGLLKELTVREHCTLEVLPVFTAAQLVHREFARRGSVAGILGMVQRFVYYGCFVAPGLVARFLILDRIQGCITQRLQALHYPWAFYVNSAMLAACLCLPIIRVIGVRFFTPRPGLP